MVGERRCQIRQVLDLEQVLVRDLQSGDTRQVPLGDLRPIALEAVQKTAVAEHDAQQLSDVHWAIAQHRLAVIQPLLARDHYGLQEVQAQAKANGYSTATLYRWLQHYQYSGRLSALVPCPRGASPGQRRLAPEVDAIIDATIEDCYLSEQKPSMRRTAIEVERRCRNAKLSPPHANTVRNRIRRLSPRRALHHRGGGKIARDRFEPIRGPYPDADWPLAVWQIDHTPVDLILVDDRHRRPVGRPWITVAIDVFSRMVAGFYISFDPPGAMAVGLCLAHAILSKETWLAKHDIKTAWPLWGKPAAVHADNAKEFRGKMLSRACENLRMDLYWRPVARPHFGGHIERLCGTLNDAIHALPGTTFANVQQRGAYPGEDKAVFTLSEFETWLAVQIVEIYHQQRHRGIGMAPVKKYEQGIFGNAEQPGIGLPERLLDETRLRLELMPYEERTVQRYGIQLDDIFYYHEVLR
jgi:putative transposase